MADWWARGLGLVGIVISLAGVVVDFFIYRQDRPKLGITVKTSTVMFRLGEDRAEMRPCAVVSIANDGGKDVRINSVSLSGGQIFGRLLRGPKMPQDLPAHGGKANWLFDYANMREQLDEQIRTQLRDNSPAAVRTVVETGNKKLTPEDAVIYVNPSGVYTSLQRPVPLSRRIRKWRRTWSRPVPSLDPYFLLTVEDFDARQTVLNVSNRYRRTAQPTQLVLIVKHADESSELVPSQPPMVVPRVPGRGSIKVAVPFIDDSAAAAGDEFAWLLKTHVGGNGSVPATVLSAVPGLAPQIDELRKAESTRADSEGSGAPS